MTDKTKIIQRICQMSKEKPEFLVNFSREQLLDYVEHIEHLRKRDRKRVLVGCQK